MRKKKTKADPMNVEIDDPENPEWTEEMFRQARPMTDFPEMLAGLLEASAKLRGRPKLETPKVQVTLRLDQEVVDGFKEDGPGWRTRMNDSLKKSVRRRRKR